MVAIPDEYIDIVRYWREDRVRAVKRRIEDLPEYDPIGDKVDPLVLEESLELFGRQDCD